MSEEGHADGPSAELKRPPPLAFADSSVDFTSSIAPLTHAGVSSSYGFEGGTRSLTEGLTGERPDAVFFELTSENRKLKERITYMEEELKRKNIELSQTRRYLEIVEGDKEALRHQEKIWKEELDIKIKEKEALEREKNELIVDKERLRRRVESDATRIKNMEAQIAQLKAHIDSARPAQTLGPTAIPRSSFPQLVSDDPFKSPPIAPPSSLPIRSEKSPEIRWHSKEDTEKESSPPRRTLAEDQYAPLQAWLRKQKMEAAFSGAYAVQGGREQTKTKSLLGRGGETRHLECPKCDKRFDSRDFSAYRRHLEDCLT